MAENDGGANNNDNTNNNHSNNTRRPPPTSNPDTDTDVTKKLVPDAALVPGRALQLQLDAEEYNHDGDDEREYDHEEDDAAISRPPPQSQESQQQRTSPTTTPTPTPLAHVRFHSRVRITSGLRHSRRRSSGGNNNNNPLLDLSSSSSDSPSSSISAPLRYRSRDAVPREPLGQRISQLASQALKRRRAAAAAKMSRGAGVEWRRVDDDDGDEYAPLARAGLPFTYGATVPGPVPAPPAAATAALNGDSGGYFVDGESSSRICVRGREDIACGSWPWWALNRHVSWAGCLSQHRSCS
jgi:hypothetical protein